MKKILLFLLLTPMLALAQYYKGTVTMNNGTTINGFIKLPKYPNDAELKFKKIEKGSKQNLKKAEVKSFEIINKQKETIRYTTLLLGRPKLFNLNKLKMNKDKSWVHIIGEGKISLYCTHIAYNHQQKTGGGGIYYIKKGNEDYALYLEEYTSGFSVTMNAFKNLKRMLNLYFEKTCPELVKSLTKEDLKENGILHIITLYEEKCGK